jgi:hypothetical protein
MKFIRGFIFGTLPLLAVSPVAFAQNLCPEGAFGTLCSKTADANSLGKIIGTGVTVAFVIAVIIALFYLIWGGIKWILSGGDKGGVEAARGTIIAAVIGLIVTFAAYFILNIVLRIFGLSLDNIKFPTL